MQWLINATILTLYFALYGIFHSFLANLTVKAKVSAWLGEPLQRGYRTGYNTIAVVTLLPFFALIAWLPNRTLYTVPNPMRWLMVGGQLLAVLGAGWTVWHTGLLHFLGLSQLWQDKPTENTPLSFKGAYRWVRHPLYTFSLCFIWLSPVMTINQLISYALFSLYFFVGSIYEEQKLVAEFGETYRQYQRDVPRLIPRLFPFPWA